VQLCAESQQRMGFVHSVLTVIAVAVASIDDIDNDDKDGNDMDIDESDGNDMLDNGGSVHDDAATADAS